jgi:hypothetical protein
LILFGWRPVSFHLRDHMCAQRPVLYASSIFFGWRPVSFHLRVHMCAKRPFLYASSILLAGDL